MLFGVKTSEEAIRIMFDYINPVLARISEHGVLNGWKPDDINAAAKGIAWKIKSLKE